MTDNGKIAIWAGWTKFVPDTDCPVLKHWMNWTAPDGTKYDTPPNYCKSDTAAVKLLPVLVERDCTFKILGAPKNYYMEIAQGPGFCPMITVERQPTIAAAITAAILQLIADKP